MCRRKGGSQDAPHPSVTPGDRGRSREDGWEEAPIRRSGSGCKSGTSSLPCLFISDHVYIVHTSDRDSAHYVRTSVTHAQVLSVFNIPSPQPVACGSLQLRAAYPRCHTTTNSASSRKLTRCAYFHAGREQVWANFRVLIAHGADVVGLALADREISRRLRSRSRPDQTATSWKGRTQH